MRSRKKLLVLSLVVAVFILLVPTLWAQDVEKININTATAEEIAQLENIGPVYAERIIEYREENGPFEKPEDIMKVKGIGTQTWELNKERITVE